MWQSYDQLTLEKRVCEQSTWNEDENVFPVRFVQVQATEIKIQPFRY